MKLLVAVDGSENSIMTTKFVAKIPASANADVHVLSVVSPEVPLGVPEIDFGSIYSKNARLRCQKSVDDAIAQLSAAGIKACGEVLEGHPAAVIVEHAEKLKADLLILGAQGHTLLSRMLLGSVSDYVATHAKCSVLVIRETPVISAEAQLKVCVGYDDSKPSLGSLEQLAELGLLKHSQVDLVSSVVLPVDSFSDVPLPFDPQEVITANEKLVGDAAQAASERFGSNIQGKVEQAVHVGLGLVHFVEREKSDLLVVGDTGRGLMSRILLGSVSRNVLRHAPCSVFISRSRVS